MKRFGFTFLSLVTLAVFVASAHGDVFYLALLGEKGDLDPDIQDAYDWGKANYKTTFLSRKVLHNFAEWAILVYSGNSGFSLGYTYLIK